MRATGMSDWTIRALIEFMQAARGGQLALVVDDAEKVLGRKPGNFAQFFEDHLAAFKSSCLNQRTIPTATA